jgi:putative endonuclease
VRAKALGDLGESLAMRHLESQGYAIRAHKWRTDRGEVDLIAQDGETLVFVEVKARASRRFGAPEEAVGPRKLARVHQAALAYLQEHDLMDVDWRVDVVAIDCSPTGAVRRLEHYQDVLQAGAELQA